MRDLPDRSFPAGSAIERLTRAARAAQQLCDVLWESLHEELREPRAEHIKELSGRLVEVSSTVALLAGAVPATDATLGSGVAPRGAAASDTTATSATPPVARSAGAIPAVDTMRAHPGGPPSGIGDQFNGPSSGVPADSETSPAPIVERRTPPAASRPDPPPAALQSIPARGGEYTHTKLVDEQESVAPVESLATVQPIQPEIEIRDVRREEGPSAWVSSVGRLLSRHAEDGLPFAVLLVEIVDVAHLERSETPHDLHGLVAKVESAVGRAMRATDHLSRETLGRYWLVAPETNGTGARMLAERLARLVRTSASHRGVPMEVAIGIAVCPDDGTEAPALAARADLGVYSARATGRSIAHTDPPPVG